MHGDSLLAAYPPLRPSKEPCGTSMFASFGLSRGKSHASFADLRLGCLGRLRVAWSTRWPEDGFVYFC